MTRLTVAIMVESRRTALDAAADAARRGTDMVEFRIDRFTDPAEVKSLVESSPLPCIVTCRIAAEGGEFDGNEATRLAAYEAAVSAAEPPAYLDVELAAWQTSPDLRSRIGMYVDHPGQVRKTDTGLILSSHDFESRPRDLYQRIEAMTAASACRVVKVAWHARSLRDNLEAFELLMQRHKPSVALCMGEFGVPSRILAKKFGALLTFAALDDGAGTAPGQPTVADLRETYRWEKIGGATRVYGVIGYPVGHSMSPAIHNAGFDATDYDGVYLPLPIPPEWEHFKATVGSLLEMQDLHFRGASVTIPHKEHLLRFVRETGGEIEPLADRIGAANTLTVRDDGSLFASNTDYAAALDAVCDSLNMQREELEGMRVAVIGAGGAARAIVAGFAHYGATVVVYNRTMEKAQALAEQFNGQRGKVVAARLEKLCDSCCQVFINCTPVGMHPNTDATPIPDKPDWTPGTVVFDTIYNPAYTRLLREARAAGCVTISGREMFVRQGAAQFEQWTGLDAPTKTFHQTLDARLSP